MTNKPEAPDFDYVTFVAERATSLMSQLGIAPTPANYSVWYSYCQGTSPELKRSIDTLFESKTPFDATTNAALVSSFGDGKAAARVGEMPNRLGSVMQDAQGFLRTASADNRSQMLAINKVASAVDAETDPRELIEGLVTELSKSVTRASRLEMNFVEA